LASTTEKRLCVHIREGDCHDSKIGKYFTKEKRHHHTKFGVWLEMVAMWLPTYSNLFALSPLYQQTVHPAKYQAEARGRQGGM